MMIKHHMVWVASLIMINVDWFQPFERTIHSSSAIYGAICNLPRELHFKPENMLILGLMPGPKGPRRIHIKLRSDFI